MINDTATHPGQNAHEHNFKLPSQLKDNDLSHTASSINGSLMAVTTDNSKTKSSASRSIAGAKPAEMTYGYIHPIKPSAVKATDTKARYRPDTRYLTCGKCHIRCGEERPICNNCKKSKCSCEANQFVAFKPPMGGRSGTVSESILPYYSGVIPGGYPVFQQPFPGPPSTGSSFS